MYSRSQPHSCNTLSKARVYLNIQNALSPDTTQFGVSIFLTLRTFLPQFQFVVHFQFPQKRSCQDSVNMNGKSPSPPQEKNLDTVHTETETGKPVSPKSDETDVNCRNLSRTDSVEKLGKLYFKLRFVNNYCLLWTKQ